MVPQYDVQQLLNRDCAVGHALALYGIVHTIQHNLRTVHACVTKAFVGTFNQFTRPQDVQLIPGGMPIRPMMVLQKPKITC